MATILNHLCRRHIFITSARTTATRIQGPSAIAGSNEGGYKTWRNLALFVAFPSICLCALNCVLGHEERDEPEEFVKYDYRCIRTKRFPWKDGNHSLFHNPVVNALPDGYEEAN
ncbi:hypothetical protein ILUMI_11609 [Ignelater luminosus]|uniref:Cytochrome c oxidase polypeptide VIa n=1 Tax=Ignelater luminosus TaxID=2038154 RepID=A0A8K0CZT3_IGNLU|nr:hypothetical protein ILUMI_11609 [Ignelater luminosus]